MAEPVDLRGVSCPSNYVHARLALEAVAEGDEIEVLLDAGEPVRNVPRSLKLDGDKVLALDAEGDHYRMRVQKGSGAIVNTLTDEEIARYGRQIIVPGVGGAGQERLKNGSVLVIGAGGLGSPSLLYLAAAGVGRIGIVDADEVDVGNLQRQIAHATCDVGRNKAESAAETISAINPLVEVLTYPVRLDADNALELFTDYDVILDGTDNFPTRYLINDAAIMLGKPLVSAAVLRYSGQIIVVRSRETGCYRCLFPVPPAAGMVPSCSQAGILGPVAGVMGSMQALEAIKLLLGSEDSIAGRFIAVDFLTLETQVMELHRDPKCAVCGDEPTITKLEQAEESCSL